MKLLKLFLDKGQRAVPDICFSVEIVPRALAWMEETVLKESIVLRLEWLLTLMRHLSDRFRESSGLVFTGKWGLGGEMYLCLRKSISGLSWLQFVNMGLWYNYLQFIVGAAETKYYPFLITFQLKEVLLLRYFILIFVPFFDDIFLSISIPHLILTR